MKIYYLNFHSWNVYNRMVMLILSINSRDFVADFLKKFCTNGNLFVWLEQVCFFRQFVRSVPKVDYLTLRHGFIMVSCFY